MAADASSTDLAGALSFIAAASGSAEDSHGFLALQLIADVQSPARQPPTATGDADADTAALLIQRVYRQRVAAADAEARSTRRGEQDQQTRDDAAQSSKAASKHPSRQTSASRRAAASSGSTPQDTALGVFATAAGETSPLLKLLAQVQQEDGFDNAASASDDDLDEEERRALYDDEDCDDDENEPRPLVAEPDALIELWKSRTRSLTPHPTMTNQRPPLHHSPGASPKRSRPLRHTRSDTPDVSAIRASSRLSSHHLSQRSQIMRDGMKRPVDPIAGRAIRVQIAREVAKKDSAFWQNRVALLRREVERAQGALDKSRADGTKSAVASIVNESVSAQLELEKQRNLKLQEEKRDAIRVQKLEHRIALRQAQRGMLQEKRTLASTFRDEAQQHADQLHALRRETTEAKAQSRARIQREKVTSMMSRVRAAALKREQARTAYETNIEEREHEAQEHHATMLAAITESTSLVDRIRTLKALKTQTDVSRDAVRALNSTGYTDTH